MPTTIDLSMTGSEIKGRITPEVKEILTSDAIQFILKLHKLFNTRRLELLVRRERKQQDINSGIMPNFLEETRAIREDNWTVASPPNDLTDRRVQITGSVNKGTIVNDLNSGANVFIADFEDSHSPTWNNIIEGQVNLKDAIEGTITYTNPETEKFYKLKEKTATLMVRPRGWHLDEKHFLIDGEYVSASLFDFGLFFFHNAQKLIYKGSGPYFYLPKIENHLEARLWNDVFVFAEEELGIPAGTIKATVIIETILAAFEMDEILFELKDHSAGLSCGGWDYLFSFIKKFRNHPKFIFPDREQVLTTSHCMQSYSLLLIKTCHKRKAHAIGGMVTQTFPKNNPGANAEALKKVITDSVIEANHGYDGTQVMDPDLVPIVKEIFDKCLPHANQITTKREDVNISAEDILALPIGTITREGLKTNIDVGIQYIEEWLRGNGSVSIYNLLEDAATAEISRTQVWQWLRNHNSALEDGSGISDELYSSILTEQLKKIRKMVGEERFNKGAYRLAAEVFDSLVREEAFTEFLTLKTYELI